MFHSLLGIWLKKQLRRKLIEYVIYLVIGINALALIFINWKILSLTKHILKVSVELLAETIIIREETVTIREVEEIIKTALVDDWENRDAT